MLAFIISGFEYMFAVSLVMLVIGRSFRRNADESNHRRRSIGRALIWFGVVGLVVSVLGIISLF